MRYPAHVTMHEHPATADTVLILGAGVHGAAIARELVLQGVAVHLVDKFDLAYGATSKSSRLIHGGLRYLEYGDLRLVRESLQARRRNLQLAPGYVQELRLFIPTGRRWSGLLRSAGGFFGAHRTGWGRRWMARTSERGFWPVRIALGMYDWFGGGLPRSTSMPVGAAEAPAVNPRRYRWLCAYSDAQMLYPERFVLALLEDTRHIAAERGVPFRLSTYCQVELQQDTWSLQDTLTAVRETLSPPKCVINATGAWGDSTLSRLQIASPALFGGTKGTHFLTWHPGLTAALRGQAVYAEADDGRLVFVLPFDEGVLVGTTDETFAAQPETAAATEDELAYLLNLVNEVMDCRLTRGDVVVHYSGVRPLPRSQPGDNAAISRDHALIEHATRHGIMLTLVGGKLTTWQEFSREVCLRALAVIGRTHNETPGPRPISGGSLPNAPGTAESGAIAETVPSLRAALRRLYGDRGDEILAECRTHPGSVIRGTIFTSEVVRRMIDREWVRTLSDLVERRLMLVFAQTLTRETLSDLADVLVAAGRLLPEHRDTEISSTIVRLQTYYGRRFESRGP